MPESSIHKLERLKMEEQMIEQKGFSVIPELSKCEDCVSDDCPLEPIGFWWAALWVAIVVCTLSIWVKAGCWIFDLIKDKL